MIEQSPKLVVVLAGQAAAAPAGAGAGAWLQLSPDTMHQHRLHSQQICLVGLCAPSAAAATLAPAAASPSSRYTSPSRPAAVSPSPSKFGPAATPVLDPESIHLVNLHLRAGLATTTSINSSSRGSNLQAANPSSSSEQQQQQQPGKHLVPVTLWPCAKLARGAAVLSPAAWNSLVQPAAGSCLAINEQQYGDSPQTAGSLNLQLCVDQQQGLPLTPQQINPDLVGSNAIDANATSSSSGGSSGLHTPISKQSDPMSSYKTPDKHSSSTSSSSRPSSGSSSSSSTKKSSSSKKGSSSKSSQQQKQQQPGSSSSSSNKADVAKQWQVRLLQDGIDWSKVKHRQLVQQLAMKQLAGRVLLPGNVTYLPVLGVQLLFQLQPASAASATAADSISQTSQHQQQQQQQQLIKPFLVTSSTRINLLMPGEHPSSSTMNISSSSASQKATAALAAATGLTAGGSTAAAAAAVSRDLVSCIAAARSAAEGAVAGSAREAAMEAAERAIRAGAAASSAGGGYSRLGGIGAYSNALKELVLMPLQLPQLFAKYKLRPPKGLLLHGPPGSGKTALARAAAVECGATLLVVNGPDIISEFYGESEAGLTGIFAAAAALSPAIIFIDELDAIAPSRESQGHGGSSNHTAAAGGGSGSSAAGAAAARVLTQLLTLMDGLSSSSSGPGDNAAAAAGGGERVVVIGATNRPSVLDPALRRPGRFERELEVGVPDPAAREDILTVKFSAVRNNLTPDQLHQLAATTHGFVGADLAALVNEAAMSALRKYVSQRQQQQPQQHKSEAKADEAQASAGTEVQQQPEPLCVSWDDVAAARLLVKPSALREVAVEVPQLTWDDVGGLSGIKQRLQEAVLWPQQHFEALQRLGAIAPKGILLYGPPGCSKTLLAKAVAATAGLNFLSVKGGELYSKYVGESERAIAALFARARGAAPAVVFFDEIDGLVSQRDDAGGGGGIGERVLAQLLTELDGLQPRLGVVVLAATNRPDKVDPALLRPGRFDRLLLVPPPDSAARQEILKVHTRRTPLGEDVDLTYIASRSEGYTGADISALCREAAMSALEEDLGIAAVSARHFHLALMRVRPSSSPSSATMAMYQQFQRHSGLSPMVAA